LRNWKIKIMRNYKRRQKTCLFCKCDNKIRFQGNQHTCVSHEDFPFFKLSDFFPFFSQNFLSALDVLLSHVWMKWTLFSAKKKGENQFLYLQGFVEMKSIVTKIHFELKASLMSSSSKFKTASRPMSTASKLTLFLPVKWYCKSLHISCCTRLSI
jgi:hypothetical protein